ncbi:MAG: EamA family transporter [Coriobacteriia bacterium]
MSLNPLRWPHKVKLVVAFATLYVVWGSTYLAIRVGLQAGLPPALFASSRLLPAGALLLGFARLRGVPVRIPWRDYRTIAIVGLFLLVGGMYLLFVSEQTLPSGLAALIVALLPLWIATGESLVPGMDRPSPLGIVGLVIGFSGLGILMAPRVTGVNGTPKDLLVIGLLVFSTWLWSTGTIVSKRFPVDVDGMVASGYQMLTAGTVLLAIGLLSGEAPRYVLTAASTGAVAYLVVFGSCIAFTAFVWALRHAPASKVMTYAYVNPVVAVFLGWAAGRVGLLSRPEPVDGWMLLGMAVIVAGVAITTTAPTRAGKPLAAEAPEA